MTPRADPTTPGSSKGPPTTRQRLLVAIAIALVTSGLAYALALRIPSLLARDFTAHWRAARAVLAGENPYLVIRATGSYPFGDGYYYPLPAVVVALPVAWLSPVMALVVSVAVWTILLAYALTYDGWYRLPLFLSAGFFWAAVLGQIVPLMMVGCLLPAFQILAIAKPSIGLAMFAYRPSRWAIIGGVLGSLLALLVVPTWPLDWKAALASDPGWHLVPLLAPGGFLVLVTLLRWRRPETRLLLALACVPQVFAFYDSLPLLLIPNTFRQALVLSLCTQIANLSATKAIPTSLGGPAFFRAIAPFAVWGCYIPPAILILTRPNEGPVPQWLERVSERLPRWLKGAESLG